MNKKRRGRGEAALRKLPSGTYELRVSRTIAGVRQRKQFYGDRQTVLDQAAAWRLNRGRARQQVGKNVTVEQYMTAWLADVKATNRLNTYRLRECMVRLYIVPHIGPLVLDQVDDDHVRGLLATLADAGIRPRSRQAVLATLACALNAAVKTRKLSENPCRFVPRPRAKKRPQHILSTDEANRLLTCASDNRFFPLYILALRTGMREGEIFALTWANIDLENAQLFVEATLTEDENGKLVRTEPKTDASKRVVALSPKTVEALRDHRRNTAGFQGYVFTTGDGVSPLRKSNFISRDFRPLLKRAGLPPITFHSLRHVANSVLLKHGASPLEAAERLGHTDTRMTLDTYGHVLSGSQTALASRLDEMFDLGQVRPNEHAQ